MGHRVMVELLKQVRKLGYTYQAIGDMVGKDRLTVIKQLDANANPTLSTVADYEDVLEGELHFINKQESLVLATSDVEAMQKLIKQQADTIQSMQATIEIKDMQMVQYIRSIEKYEASIAKYQDYISKLTDQVYDIVMSHEKKEG